MGGYGVVPGGTASLSDIITGYGREKGLASSAQAQPALIEAETEHNRALADQERQKAEFMRRQAKDAEVLQRVYAGIDKTADSKTMMQQARNSAIRLGMSAKGVMDLDTHHAGLLKSQAELDDKAHELESAKFKEAGDVLMGIRQLPVDQRPAAWQLAAARLMKLDPASGFSEQYPGDVGLEAHVGAHALGEKVLGERKTTQEILTSQAQQGAAQASTAHSGALTTKTNQETAEAARVAALGRLAAAAGSRLSYTQELANLKRTNPELAAALPADSEVFDASGKARPEVVERIRQAGMKPQEQAQVIGDAAQRAETERAHKADEATARSRVELDRKREEREGKIYEATYGAGADPALVAVDPKARNQARTAALKVGQDLIKAQKSADEMQHFVDLARSGNKAAYANMPVAGVLAITTASGTTRVNRNELEAYGHAGSLFDKLSGKLGGLVAGKPIPDDVLKDIEELHKTIRQSAESAAQKQLDNVNQTYRSTFKLPGGGHSEAPREAMGGYQIGHLYGNQEYLGGDINDPKNWKAH